MCINPSNQQQEFHSNCHFNGGTVKHSQEPQSKRQVLLHVSCWSGMSNNPRSVQSNRKGHITFVPNTWNDAILVTTCRQRGENVHINCSVCSERSGWKINHTGAFFPHYFYFISWVFWPKVLKKQSWQLNSAHSQMVTDLPSQSRSSVFLLILHVQCFAVCGTFEVPPPVKWLAYE